MSIFDRFAKNLMAERALKSSNRADMKRFNKATDIPKPNKHSSVEKGLIGSVALTGAAAVAASQLLPAHINSKMDEQFNKESKLLASGKGTPEERKQWKANIEYIKAVRALKQKAAG